MDNVLWIGGPLPMGGCAASGGKNTAKMHNVLPVFVATVGFRGFGHDRGGGVAALHITGGGGDDSGSSAGLQTEGCAKGCERCDEHRDHDFDDLLFGHNS